MKLAFYKAKYGSFLEKVLAFITRGPYSHVELIIEQWPDDKALCFSSSPVEKGVRFKSLLLDEAWDIIEINLENDHMLQYWFAAQINKSYDWAAIWHWFIPMYRDSSKSWYCSELIATTLNRFGDGYNLPVKISVNELYKRLNNEKAY